MLVECSAASRSREGPIQRKHRRDGNGLGGQGMRYGVALSGGGHRATVWTLGGLLALVDAGLNPNVVSVSSVSGGSIANGAVAHGGDYQTMTGPSFVKHTQPAMRLATIDGLFFHGPLTDGYVRQVFATTAAAVAGLVALVAALVTAGRGVHIGWSVGVGLAPALVGSFVLSRRQWRQKLRGDLRVSIVGGLVATLPMTLVAVGWTTSVDGFAIPLVVAFLAATLLLLVRHAVATFGKRSQKVVDALATSLFTGDDGKPTLLADVAQHVHHVFCATELQSGDHVYLTPKLITSYRAGKGQPNDLTLADAVQASACLPGGFVARELDTADFDMTRPWPVEDNQPSDVPPILVVNDGGVYDNMADQWEQGFNRRLQRNPDLSDIQDAADTLVVINAGKALGWQPFKRARGINAEVRGLTRSLDILYDVSTSHRRQGLVARFKSHGPDRMDGALVHIAQTPFDIPEAFKGRTNPETGRRTDEAERAKTALDLLEELGMDEKTWTHRASRNSQVKTGLRPLGQSVTADLLEHAYLLATINLFVILGSTPLPTTDDGTFDLTPFARQRFDDIARADPPHDAMSISAPNLRRDVLN